eukprot:m.310341 g.310341  ORF g.310341 m.310341 type:complete len:62 (+) comp50987_c0_seq1:388-573(+)
MQDSNSRCHLCRREIESVLIQDPTDPPDEANHKIFAVLSLLASVMDSLKKVKEEVKNRLEI